MVSYEHKIRNIYLGDNSWSPNEDTIAYFPFKEDFDDKVGNRTLTVSNCYISGGYNILHSSSSYMKLSSTIGGSILTGSVWYYYGENSIDGWNTLFAREGGTYHHILFPSKSSNGTVGNIGFYSSNFYPSSRILTSGKWYHIVFVKNGTNEKIYVNAELVQDSNSSFDNNTYPLGMISNYQISGNQGAQGKMSELIFESKERSQQEITKYYKGTRTDYGYSGKDYQEVEYIESSGSGNTGQHINTGYIVSNNTKVQFKISDWGQRTGQIFGVATIWASGGKCFSIVFDAYTFNNVYNLAHGFNDGAVHIGELSQEGLYKDGTKLSTPSATTFTAAGPLAIFCINYQGGSGFVEHTSNRLYFFKIYEGENLVRDFIPCYRTADDAIGLYDKVNNVFYTNSGTGTFTKGPDVSN